GQADVVADDAAHLLAVDEPGGAIEAKLDVLGAFGLDVDMVVSVIADGVPGQDEVLQPGDAGLFEGAADGEEMEDAAVGPDAAGGLDGVALGGGVEVALFVVPVGLVPGGEVARHLQVEGDGDEGLTARGRCGAGRGGEHGGAGGGEEAAA